MTADTTVTGWGNHMDNVFNLVHITFCSISGSVPNPQVLSYMERSDSCHRQKTLRKQRTLTTMDVRGHKEGTVWIPNHPFDLYLSLFNRVLVPESFKEQLKSVRHTICLNGPQVLKARDEKFNIRFVKYFTADGIILAEMTNDSAYPSN